MDTPTAYALCLLEKLRNQESTVSIPRAILYVDSEEPEDLRHRLVKKDSSLIVQKSLPCGDYYLCVNTELKKDQTSDKNEHIVAHSKNLKNRQKSKAAAKKAKESLVHVLESVESKTAATKDKKTKETLVPVVESVDSERATKKDTKAKETLVPVVESVENKIADAKTKETLVYVVERKSLSDFNGALDQRHKDQLYRLLHLPIPRHHIIYFIEYQDESKIQHYKGLDVILKEINEIHVRYGITIYWSYGKSMTLLYLMHLLDQVIQSKTDLESGFFAVETKNETMEPCLRAYPPVRDLFEFAKKGISKKGNDSPQFLFLTQLRAIRGMGEAKAKAIQREYSSWSQLEQLRTSVGEKDAIEELANLSIDGATKRRLGKAMAKKVIHSLVCK